MIRQLYNLEDWLFYRSRSCGTGLSRVMEACSWNIGQLADRLNMRSEQGRVLR